MTEKKKSRTSTAVKTRYNNKVYDTISARVPKDIAAAFKAKCVAENVSQAKIIKNAIDDFINHKQSDYVGYCVRRYFAIDDRTKEQEKILELAFKETKEKFLETHSEKEYYELSDSEHFKIFYPIFEQYYDPKEKRYKLPEGITY